MMLCFYLVQIISKRTFIINLLKTFISKLVFYGKVPTSRLQIKDKVIERRKMMVTTNVIKNERVDFFDPLFINHFPFGGDGLFPLSPPEGFPVVLVLFSGLDFFTKQKQTPCII